MGNNTQEGEGFDIRQTEMSDRNSNVFGVES